MVYNGTIEDDTGSSRTLTAECHKRRGGHGTMRRNKMPKNDTAKGKQVVETPGIGELAVMLMRKGLGAAEALGKIKLVFPTCKTTMKGMYYYANHAEPKIVLSQRSQADPKALKAVLAGLGKRKAS
jgi:hypothetical protein